MWPPVLTGSKVTGDWWTSSSPVHGQSSNARAPRAADPHPVTYAGGIERQFRRDMLSSGGGLHTLRSLFDKRCDRLGLRHVDSMAALDLHDRRTCPLGHGTLGIRWDHLVVGGDQVPA